jgi:hypothetical protein
MWNPFRRKTDKSRVSHLGRDEMMFVDGDHRMTILAELMAAGRFSRVISASTIRAWLPPHEQEPISDSKKREILTEVLQYFENAGRKVALEKQPWCADFPHEDFV